MVQIPNDPFEIYQRLARVETKLDSLDEKIERLINDERTRIDDHEERIKRNEQILTEISTGLKILKYVVTLLGGAVAAIITMIK